MALGGRHFGLFIHDVLEVVDHRAVGDERQRAGEVAVEELLRVSGPKKPSAHGSAKNSMDIEWTSQASMLGQMQSMGMRYAIAIQASNA